MIASTLRTLRRSRGLTQKEVASMLNLSQQAISKWENGYAEPSSQDLQRLADFYHVTVDYIMGHETADTSGIEVIVPRDEMEQKIIRMAQTLDPARKMLLLQLAEAVVRNADSNGGVRA